jgi:uncharacterized protein (DUF488 family)
MGMASYRIALMCAEKDPMTCHRTILVCRNVSSIGISDVRHILEDGRIEANAETERRLLDHFNIQENDLFASYAQLVAQAYELQGRKIAFSEKSDE